jgi:hypothetical protein
VQNAFDLQARAQSVWSALQAPQALRMPGSKQAAWLVVQPSAVGVSPLDKDGSDLRIDLSIAGRIAVLTGAEPKVETLPLPALSGVDGPAGFHVHADLRVPSEVLSAGLDRALRGLRVGGKRDPKLTIVSAQVLTHADKKHPRRIVVRLALDGALRGDVELEGELAYDAASQRLSIEGFDFTVASQGAHAEPLQGFDRTAICKQVAAKAHWDLGAESAPLQKAVMAALNATVRDQVQVSGALTQLEVRDFALQPDALSADVVLGGALQVHYAPR